MTHGSKHFDIVAPRSKLYKGPFGRLFPGLPAWAEPGVSDSPVKLLEIANDLMIERPGKKPSDIATDNALIEELEEEFSSNIPAGYTYFGQFVDHDVTFDPASSLMRRNDPNGLDNFRTPRLDLDNIYGAGPDDQPYLYDPDDKAKLAVGHIEGRPDLPDLPRFKLTSAGGEERDKSTALIGDMRNDENAMVSQLQLAFLLAHNSLVDRAREKHTDAETSEIFEIARKTLRWLYQYIVWNDFIPRITVDAIYKCSLKLTKKCGDRMTWDCGLDDIYNWKHQPFMPIEFSVAAYRFGHSMVRNSYQTNAAERGFSDGNGNRLFAPIFDNTGDSSDPDDLRGFRPMKPENCIQWDWFLPMESSGGPFPQMARKIDTKLSNALAFLFEDEAGDPNNVLAFRNLQRSVSFDLPSGSSIAKALSHKPIKLKQGEPDALWYYVLREAQGNGGNTLGKVGSTIVCAVFAGLLKGDPSSWFNIEPTWKPDDDELLTGRGDNRDDPNWTLASIIRLAGLKANGIGFESSSAN